MAIYKRPAELATSTSEAFDKEYSPGSTVPHSGIYRCLGCGREIASNAGDPFPPQNHHQHSSYQRFDPMATLGLCRWRPEIDRPV